MKTIVYGFLAAILLGFGYVVFRLVVRRDYAARGRLSVLASSLQLFVFAGLFSFPYQFNPPEWPWFWIARPSSSQGLHWVGLMIICCGFLVAFGTMLWFGIKQAFGMSIEGLKVEGPYKVSRNPQVLGGYLLVLGTSVQWPSFYSLGWLLLYAVITHWMVITEEEHLLRIYGKEYEAYCASVPRYLFPRGSISST